MNVFKSIKPYIDKKLIYLTIGFYSAFSLFSLLKMIYFKSTGVRFGDQTWSFMFFESYFVDYVIVILFMSIALIITKQLIIKKYKLIFIILTHLVLSILLGLTIFFSLFFVQNLTGSINSDVTFSQVFHYYMNVIDLNFLIYFSLVVITHIYINQKEIKKIKLDEVKLRESLAKNKLQALKSQIQPHFLFNTLNNIVSLIDIDKNKSKSILVDLSDLLREMIDNRNDNLWELKEELYIVDKYLDILKVRFSDDIKIIKNIDNETTNALIPSMLIQTLIENAIKHGYSSKNTQLTIQIISKKSKDKLKIIVKNNGESIEEPIQKTINNGSGLTNLIERMKIIYQTDFLFKISNISDEVVAETVIPFIIAEYKIHRN